ncbi:hypothetical protein [Corynebacterium auriscanis]
MHHNHSGVRQTTPVCDKLLQWATTYSSGRQATPVCDKLLQWATTNPLQ